MKTSYLKAKFKLLFNALFIVCILIAAPQDLNAQLLKKLKKKAEDKIEREAEKRAEKRINEKIDKGYDKAEDAIDGRSKKKNDSIVNNSKSDSYKCATDKNTEAKLEDKLKKPQVVCYQGDGRPHIASQLCSGKRSQRVHH